jgi:hypothetical protein
MPSGTGTTNHAITSGFFWKIAAIRALREEEFFTATETSVSHAIHAARSAR